MSVKMKEAAEATAATKINLNQVNNNIKNPSIQLYASEIFKPEAVSLLEKFAAKRRDLFV